jgi:hypothetical protein
MTNVDDLPRNYVLAVVDGSDSAAKAVIELERAGFHDTLVFKDEELQDTQDEKKGNILSKALKLIPEHLSEESDYMEQYQEEAEKGSSIVAVRIASSDRVQVVGDILLRFGARNTRFFGGLMVTDLSAPSNPSAREDVTRAPTA